eukprot:scaffold221736_cov24-Tisochrysis_lutea.AAC.3
MGAAAAQSRRPGGHGGRHHRCRQVDDINPRDGLSLQMQQSYTWMQYSYSLCSNHAHAASSGSPCRAVFGAKPLVAFTYGRLFHH